MVVCHQRKIIFIHIPKTGGSSIETMLSDNGRYELHYHCVRNGRSQHHLTAFELKYALGPMYQNYFKFAFIRDPYDKMISEYYWCKTPRTGYRSGQSFDDFLKYVEDVVNNQKYFKYIDNDHFIPQYYYLFHNKKLLVGNIYKFEEINTVLPMLKAKFKINAEIPHLNKSIKKDEEKLVLTDEQKERIYKLYKIDFDVFNYPK